MRKRSLSVLAALMALGLPAAAIAGAGSAAAATAPGSLDPTFGTGGKVLSNLGVQGTPSDAVLQPNGDIVVAGGFGVARYLPSGKLDTSFGTGGLAQTGFNDMGFAPAGVVLQPDGKIIWAGNNTAEFPNQGGDLTSFAIARFTSAGKLDTGFGAGGQVTTEFFNPVQLGALEAAQAVLVQRDGKILVGGLAMQGQVRRAPQQAAMVRLNANGTLDTTFGSGGRVLSTAPGITALGLDAAGDIFTLPGNAEFGPSGQADALVTPAPITISSHGGAAAFLPGGQFVIASTSGVTRHDTDVQVRRFSAAGALASASPAFDFNGVDGNASDFPGAIAVQANGQAVAGGGHFLDTSVFGLARVNADGSLDQAFGSAGTLTTSFQGAESVTALVVQPDGKIVAVGFSEDNSTGQVGIALARYLG
jgi:uncharacterized delta-60 repeat protein